MGDIVEISISIVLIACLTALSRSLYDLFKINNKRMYSFLDQRNVIIKYILLIFIYALIAFYIALVFINIVACILHIINIVGNCIWPLK